MGITLEQLQSAIGKVKQYVNDKFPVVSPNEGNAILNKENGIFVEDKQPQLNKLQKQMDKSNFVLVDNYDPCKDIIEQDLSYYLDFFDVFRNPNKTIANIVNTGEEFINNDVAIYDKKGVFPINGYLHGNMKISYPLTIEFLVQFDSTTKQTVFFENSNPCIVCGYWTDSFILRIATSKTWAYDFNELSNKINLISICYISETDVKLYINGILINEQEKTNSWGTSSFTGTYIGRRSYKDTHFIGDMYRVRVYNRILTQEEILTNYNADMKFLESSVEHIKQYELNIIDYANKQNGIEDTPVGHIISHMGTTAPKHYLICDGAEYNITDYPYLAQHIQDNFGTVNFFGGDGTTTFAVPDLRGEFLRGTGTATRDAGSGAEVGVHQDPTEHPDFYVANLGKSFYSGIDGTSDELGRNQANNKDTVNRLSAYGYVYSSGDINTNAKVNMNYTSRPTNTSVLYCIKYEPTYYMVRQNTNYMQPSIYSEEERVIGSWLNGKPIYEKTINFVLNNANKIQAVNYNVENIEKVIDYSMFVFDSQNTAIPIGYRESSNSAVWISGSAGKEYFYVLRNDVNHWANCNSIITIKYTKTTDEPNSFTTDMIKDYIVQTGEIESYSDEEVINAVNDLW